jgi:hypothetical protein
VLGRFTALTVVALLLAAGISAAAAIQIRAFQNGKLVNLVYFDNFTCIPAPAAVYMNSSESINAASVTACEFGSAVGVNTTGGIPRWDLIPAFAGLSVYGYSAYGSTLLGYPVYNGNAVLTECSANRISNACIHRPAYVYSPIISAIEHGLNISDGINGLPEGVLPNAARDILASPKKNSTVSRSYDVRVWVLDPNIFPNPSTGKCQQVAPSSLADPTAHCLTSVVALQAAISTNDTAVPTINANNIFWKVANRPDTQAVILVTALLPGNSTNPQFVVQQSDDINISNTNMFVYSFIGNASQITATTTIAQTQKYSNAQLTLTLGALMIIAILVVWYLARGRLWMKHKAQSAMEYLMTYGWALLILAVILSALYSLGVFNSSSSLASDCIGISGWSCSSPTLAQNDNITFSLGQFVNGKAIYNVAAACSSSMGATGLPNPSPPSGSPYAAMVYLSATGAATNVVANSATSGSLALSAGQKVTVTGLTCYGTTVGPTITPVIGTSFVGYIWVNYTINPGAPVGSNPMLTTRIATVTAKVSH